MGMAEVRVDDPAGLLEVAAENFVTMNMNFTCCAISTTWTLGGWRDREWCIANDTHKKLHNKKEWWNMGLEWPDSKPSWREDKRKALLETAAYLRSENGRASAIGYSAFN